LGRLEQRMRAYKEFLRRMKPKHTAFSAVFLIVVIFMGLIQWGVLFPPPHRELMGTTVVYSWVPVYVLYDPPGALSYSECSGSSGPVTLRLEGVSDGIQVRSEYSTYINGGFGSGVDASSLNLVYALELNQTWQLWRYSDGINIWLQAELANCSYWGDGVFGFDDTQYVNNREMWVDNMTGDQSPYGLQWNVTSGTTKEVTFDCTQKEFISLGAGYLVNIFGHDFCINVSISTEGAITNMYVFNNNMTSLDVQMMCNGAITQISPNHYKTDGALLWFSD
jgi:hypothetical protein